MSREDGCPSSRTESRSVSPLLFCLYSGTQGIGDLPTLVSSIFFTQSVDSDSNLFQKLSPRHPGRKFYPGFEHPLVQTYWHIKLSIPVWSFEPAINCKLLAAFRGPHIPGLFPASSDSNIKSSSIFNSLTHVSSIFFHFEVKCD